MRTIVSFHKGKNIICTNLYDSNKCPVFKSVDHGYFRNNALMQYESHNDNNFIILFAKYFYRMDFIFTLDS